MITGVAIIKNEQGRIVPTLESFLPFVDRFVLYDTGSTDSTLEEVSAWLDEQKDKESEIISGPFVDYSSARNRALSAADQGPGWLLMFDCDMRISGDTFSIIAGVARILESVSGASLPCQLGECRFDRRCLFRSGVGLDGPGTPQGWHFEYPVHEVALGPGPCARLETPVLTYDIQDHARRQERWRSRDLPLIEAFLKENPKDARMCFYRAQTLECLREFSRAEAAYQIALKVSTFPEERFTIQCRIGDCQESQGNKDGALASWSKAWALSPERAEPLEKISRYFLSEGHLIAAWHYAQAAATLPYPKEAILFVDSDLYNRRAREYRDFVEGMVKKTAEPVETRNNPLNS